VSGDSYSKQHAWKTGLSGNEGTFCKPWFVIP